MSLTATSWCGHGHRTQRAVGVKYPASAWSSVSHAAAGDYRNNSKCILTQRVLYSSYMGPVSVNVLYNNETSECLMEGTIQLGQETMNTKVINAREYGLDSEAQYASAQLIGLRPQILSSATNLLVYSLILRMRLLLAPVRKTPHSEITQLANFLARAPSVPDHQIIAWARANCTPVERSLVQQILRAGGGGVPPRVLESTGANFFSKLLNLNSAVDCLFHSQQYLLWLYATFQQVGIGTPSNTLITINGFAMDNAYFTGEYMAIGTGLQMFNDMASPDVMAHESFYFESGVYALVMEQKFAIDIDNLADFEYAEFLKLKEMSTV